MYEYNAFVNGVYDGDTITVDIDLGFGVFMKNQKIRLFGINTPEIRGEERNLGLISRDILRKWILEKNIIIHTQKDQKGKYGRWLGTIIIKDESGISHNINEKLLNEGYANPYLE
ncbi:MAG: hypothetical protein HC831_19010 [Chloroflexia bacterium]|nr:hypothetical protein [Chloroflexia bacterium]